MLVYIVLANDLQMKLSPTSRYKSTAFIIRN